MKSKCSFFEIIVAARDFWTCFMEKMRFQQKPHLFLFFIVAQFQVKLAKKCLNYFLTFWHQKMKLADGFMCETDIKLWNWSFSQFYAKKAQKKVPKKCPSFIETAPVSNNCPVSSVIWNWWRNYKITVKRENFCWNWLQKVSNFV